jgi:hypothetical protein
VRELGLEDGLGDSGEKGITIHRDLNQSEKLSSAGRRISRCLVHPRPGPGIRLIQPDEANRPESRRAHRRARRQRSGSVAAVR